MTKKERYAVQLAVSLLQNEVFAHNKNLTKKQYFALDETIEILENISKEDNK